MESIPSTRVVYRHLDPRSNPPQPAQPGASPVKPGASLNQQPWTWITMPELACQRDPSATIRFQVAPDTGALASLGSSSRSAHPLGLKEVLAGQRTGEIRLLISRGLVLGKELMNGADEKTSLPSMKVFDGLLKIAQTADHFIRICMCSFDLSDRANEIRYQESIQSNLPRFLEVKPTVEQAIQVAHLLPRGNGNVGWLLREVKKTGPRDHLAAIGYVRNHVPGQLLAHEKASIHDFLTGPPQPSVCEAISFASHCQDKLGALLAIMRKGILRTEGDWFRFINVSDDILRSQPSEQRKPSRRGFIISAVRHMPPDVTFKDLDWSGHVLRKDVRGAVVDDRSQEKDLNENFSLGLRNSSYHLLLQRLPQVLERISTLSQLTQLGIIISEAEKSEERDFFRQLGWSDNTFSEAYTHIVERLTSLMNDNNQEFFRHSVSSIELAQLMTINPTLGQHFVTADFSGGGREDFHRLLAEMGRLRDGLPNAPVPPFAQIGPRYFNRDHPPSIDQVISAVGNYPPWDYDLVVAALSFFPDLTATQIVRLIGKVDQARIRDLLAMKASEQFLQEESLSDDLFKKWASYLFADGESEWGYTLEELKLELRGAYRQIQLRRAEAKNSHTKSS